MSGGMSPLTRTGTPSPSTSASAQRPLRPRHQVRAEAARVAGGGAHDRTGLLVVVVVGVLFPMYAIVMPPNGHVVPSWLRITYGRPGTGTTPWTVATSVPNAGSGLKSGKT